MENRGKRRTATTRISRLCTPTTATATTGLALCTGMATIHLRLQLSTTSRDTLMILHILLTTIPPATIGMLSLLTLNQQRLQGNLRRTCRREAIFMGTLTMKDIMLAMGQEPETRL
jgi:hypothetical protein